MRCTSHQLVYPRPVCRYTITPPPPGTYLIGRSKFHQAKCTAIQPDGDNISRVSKNLVAYGDSQAIMDRVLLEENKRARHPPNRWKQITHILHWFSELQQEINHIGGVYSSIGSTRLRLQYHFENLCEDFSETLSLTPTFMKPIWLQGSAPTP